MTDTQDIQYILGVQIYRNRTTKTLTLTQEKYINEILEKFNMLNANPVSTPLEAGIRYSIQSSHDLLPHEQADMTTVPYKQAIGSLQYLVTCTRWDLTFSVQHLAQFMANPAPIHYLGIKRVLCYLNGTRTQGLTYTGPKLSPNHTLHQLVGWSDADWGGDLDTRRSTSGYMFQIDSCLISWQSRKQSVVALSSTEAEYIAIAIATKELIWLQAIIQELGYSLALPSTLFCDNQSCIALSKNPKFHDRSKHIDLRFHFLREKVNSQLLSLEYTPTSDMWADILTKSLPKIKHYACIEGIHTSPTQAPQKWGVHQHSVTT